jgi:hypothetical protein
MLTSQRAADPKFARVLVVPLGKCFVVHEKLLIHHPHFSRAALDGRSKEAEEKVVRLQDTEPEVFECVVHWLYYQRFPDERDDEGLLEIWSVKADGAMIASSLIKMYVFRDQHLAPQLQRDALDHLYRHLEDYASNYNLPNPTHIARAFNYLATDSPLCRYLVNTMINYSDNRLGERISTP